MQTPTYIKTLLKPSPSKGGSRKVWSVDLENVWVPFFTASNVNGDTAVPKDALGAPFRLAKETDGSVKFSKTGRPVLRVAPELNAQIRMVRENFVAGLMSYTEDVAKSNAKGFQAEVEACQKAGDPINRQTVKDIEEGMQARLEAEQAQAEAEEITSRETVGASA